MSSLAPSQIGVIGACSSERPWSALVLRGRATLQQVLIVVALNVVRLVAWLAGRPRAQTRMAPFARLAPLGMGGVP